MRPVRRPGTGTTGTEPVRIDRVCASRAVRQCETRTERVTGCDVPWKDFRRPVVGRQAARWTDSGAPAREDRSREW
jgi:hypothetical protein